MPLESLLALDRLWVEKYDNRHALIAKTVINHVGQDPAQFKIRFP